jgi:hypothetical protein
VYGKASSYPVRALKRAELPQNSSNFQNVVYSDMLQTMESGKYRVHILNRPLPQTFRKINVFGPFILFSLLASHAALPMIILNISPCTNVTLTLSWITLFMGDMEEGALHREDEVTVKQRN